MYQVLARKWRPKDFSSLVGQTHVVKALTNALEQQRLHHAYLFTGTRGVGKTTLARIFAKSLNCQTGITVNSCGQCQACREIDEGRFVDYVEMDAASTRGVDEMTALLEQAMYACVDARFKIYMIDEVHMLTQHAFNAMLKTLEEPPAHVKFILATTDPQKIPVTVLSRCLQFNLKQMSAAHIIAQLEKILHEEGINFEPQALRLLASAADGSMRDALSLTDQAIAYTAHQITEEAIRHMLGALDQRYLVRLLDAIATANSAAALAIADQIATHSLSFSAALKDLARLLHRIAWAQFSPASVLDEWPDTVDIHRFAKTFSCEQVQLYYQIATIGCNELGLAPDAYAGFTMTLLRMFAFSPILTQQAHKQEVGAENAENIGDYGPTGEKKKPYPEYTDTDTDTNTKEQCLNFDGDWPSLVTRLPLRGLAKEFAMQSEFIHREGSTFKVRVPSYLYQPSLVDKLNTALTTYFGMPLNAAIEVGAAQHTAATVRNAREAQCQQEAECAMQQDASVQALIHTFDAKVITNSVRPV